MEIDEPEKPPIDHVAMTFEQLTDGWRATAQTNVGELSATGASIAEAKASLRATSREAREVALRQLDPRRCMHARGPRQHA